MGFWSGLVEILEAGNNVMKEVNSNLEEYNKGSNLRVETIKKESELKLAEARKEFIREYGKEAYNEIKQ